ncbi:hypothetical protein BgiBS90_008119, partial [Biomphalaria glabrata]
IKIAERMIVDFQLLVSLVGLFSLPISADYQSALDNVGLLCKGQVLWCISQSSEVKALVDQELYCAAIQYNSGSFSSKSCLVSTFSGCNMDKYNFLQDQACYAVGNIGSIQVRYECQRQTEICLSKSNVVLDLYNTQQYCDAVSYSSSIFSSKTCMVTDGYCFEYEYQNVYNSVCNVGTTYSPSLTTYSPASGSFYLGGVTISFTCYTQSMACKSKSSTLLGLFTSEKYCDALSYSDSSFSTKTCLVTNGGCSDFEYSNVKDYVCTSKTTYTIGDVTVSGLCYSQATNCLSKSSTVRALYDSQQYCAALTYSKSDFNSKSCLVTTGGCSEDEYSYVKSMKCNARSMTAGVAVLILSLFSYTMYV